MAAATGHSRQRVRLATRDEALDACGYAPGTVPPFAHRRPLPTYVDRRLLALEGGWVFAGGGDPDVELALDVATLVQHTQAKVG